MNLRRIWGAPLLALVAGGVTVTAAAVTLGYVATQDEDEPDRYLGAIITSNPPELPDVVLTDQYGQPFNLREQTADTLTLLYVGYTHCPDICPAHLHEIAQALERLPEDVTKQVKVVFVTADPERDTPEVLELYLGLFNKDFVGLTGTREQTDAFQLALGIHAASRTDLGGGNYAVNHAAYVMAFTKDQHAYTIYPTGMGVKELMNDIPLLAKKGFAP
jgi:protein SCO1/2